MSFMPSEHPSLGRVIMGVRPEHVRVVDPSAVGAPAASAGDGSDVVSLDVVVDIVEELGSESYVYAHPSGGADVTIVAKLHSGPSPAPGTELQFKFDRAHAHFFNPETGVRVDA